jgi:hypothetical protein
MALNCRRDGRECGSRADITIAIFKYLSKLGYRKFRAFTFSVSMCRSGSYISRGREITLGSRLSSPLPPRLASSPRPGWMGNASSSPETRLSWSERSITCSTTRCVTPLACCTLPQQPSMVAPRIARRLVYVTVRKLVVFSRQANTCRPTKIESKLRQEDRIT